MKKLIEKRRLKRSEATKTLNAVKGDLDALSILELNQNISYIIAIRESLEKLDEEIQKVIISSSEDHNLAEEIERCETYNKECIFVIASLKTVLEEKTGRRSNDMHSTSFANKLTLPNIPLPEFSNKEGESLVKFLSDFDQILDKSKLTSYEKYVYLQRQLKGDPLTLIKSLELTEQNYDEACNLLKKAFACTTSQQFTTLSRLSNLKFGDDPYEFISAMRQISESFKTLNIESSTVLQYFIWDSIPYNLKTQFTHITNSNYPTLEQINEHIFTAIERFSRPYSQKINKPQNKSVSHSANAAMVKTSKYYCRLCSSEKSFDYTHSTFDCNKFSNPKSKIERIKELNGCIKCANVNHTTEECRYRFKKRCENCGQFHFSILCMKGTEEKKNKSKIKPTKDNLSSQTVFVGKTLFSQYGEDVILPTFSKRFQDGSVIRAMRDSGCQPNFITHKAAMRLKLKILKENFNLNVSGFNSSDTYKTKLYELKVDYSQPPIKVIGMDEIKTKIKLPGLSKVVTGFVNAGYEIADEFLMYDSEEISGLDLILGNNDAHILPLNDVTFGSDPLSMYQKSDLGVMLMGSVKRYLANMRKLPSTNQSIEPSSEVVNKSTDRTELISSEGECSVTTLNSFQTIVDPTGHIHDSELDEAVKSLMRENSSIQYDLSKFEDDTKVTDDQLNQYVLENIKRGDSGRLEVPLLWNDKVAHLLGRNINLSKLVLQSNMKRIAKSNEKLELYDQTFKSHLADGIIEPINDLNKFIKEHPNASFIPHMGVFRIDHKSTKCRIVLLSNLVEKSSSAISHNQAMVSGENLNQKISTTVTKLRFDKYIVVFDIVKAFLNIAIREVDQDKLMIIWYRNVKKKDFSLVGYRYKRLPFGLRPSPVLLMLSLFKILIVDASNDPLELCDLKKLIYDLSYMDNCALSSNSMEDLKKSYELVNSIFNPYQLNLQQFVTNHDPLQTEIDGHEGDTTAEEVKVLGLNYNRLRDTLATVKLSLNPAANTKRMIISSIASNYDVLQINGPLLNRARLFAHKLQCDPDRGWDDAINKEEQREWKNLSKQLNSAPSLIIERYVGDRSAEYELIGFTDASKDMFGAVLYLKDRTTGKVSFIRATNRIITKQFRSKSIPCLELHSIAHGVEVLLDTFKELSGDKAVVPINIVNISLFSDSMVALSWINSHINKLDKTQKLAPFVINRVDSIARLCEKKEIKFQFISGTDNPADYVTRAISYSLLKDSCYLKGPDVLSNNLDYVSTGQVSFKVPNPLAKSGVHSQTVSVDKTVTVEHLVPVERYSSLQKLVKVYSYVKKFAIACMNKLKQRKSETLPANGKSCEREELLKELLRREQQIYYPDVMTYFDNPLKNQVPNLVGQLGLFRDVDGLLKVKSKFKEWKANINRSHPILLANNSKLTYLIISDVHHKFAHAGIYSVLANIRKQFYVTKSFSTVKKVLRDCTICRRFNSRVIHTNQSYYRNFRENPPSVPFRFIFLDHFGPYKVTINGKTVKVWILCICCLWSRAINLKLSYDMTTNEFLRCLQLHIFEYGLPELVMSDLGSQIVAGGNILSDMMKDHKSKEFFDDHNMKVTQFVQYSKGCHELGSLVESCVKLSRRLIDASLRRNVLTHSEFELLVSQSKHLVNKRPICFKESLRSDANDAWAMPEPISPEQLIHGFELPSIDIIPAYNSEQGDKDWISLEKNQKDVRHSFDKLSKVRGNLKIIYNEEFLGTLLNQAVNTKDRYRTKSHFRLKVGDVVLLKEEHVKALKYPLGLIVSVEVNDLEEVTSCKVRKGNGEMVIRHVNSIIPYMTEIDHKPNKPDQKSESEEIKNRHKREAAVQSEISTRNLLRNNLV